MRNNEGRGADVAPSDDEMVERATAFLSDPKIKPMPTLIAGVRNGTIICATRDMPELGIEEGAMFPVVFDGTHVRGGSLDGPAWSIEQLMEEMDKRRWWTIQGQLDEWTR